MLGLVDIIYGDSVILLSKRPLLRVLLSWSKGRRLLDEL
jgi:hypothetical protein